MASRSLGNTGKFVEQPKRVAASGRRPRSPELSLPQIVDAARRSLGDGGQPSDLNLRSLAEGLGVTAMALYRYVGDKDGLLELIVDELLAEVGLPEGSPGRSWQSWAVEACTSLFRLITTAPVAAYVFTTRPVVTPSGLRRTEAFLGSLRLAGFADDEALAVYAVLHTYTVGFAVVAHSREVHRPSGTSSTRQAWRAFFASLDPADYPNLVALAPDLALFSTTTQFHRGLERMISGIAPPG